MKDWPKRSTQPNAVHDVQPTVQRLPAPNDYRGTRYRDRGNTWVVQAGGEGQIEVE